MPATSPAYCTALQQRRALTRRRSSRQFISSTIRREQLEVLLILLPTDVAGMSIWDAGEPVTTVVLLLDLLLAVGSSPIPATAVHVHACVSGVCQDAHSGRNGQRPEHRGAASAPGRKSETLLPKGLHGLACRADTRKRLEKVDDCVPDLRVGIESHVANVVIYEAGRQRTPILAASHLVKDAAAQPGFKDVKLGFAHRSFQTEQQTVVEVRRIVHTIFIEDQRIGQRADLKQSMPISIVPRQTRDFQSHDDACAAHAHVSDKLLKTFAPGGRRARFSLIAIDDDDLTFMPAECDRSAAQCVLTLRALDVLDDLPHR